MLHPTFNVIPVLEVTISKENQTNFKGKMKNKHSIEQLFIGSEDIIWDTTILVGRLDHLWSEPNYLFQDTTISGKQVV